MRPAVGLLLFYKEKNEENENMENYKIAVAGTGYVGLSLSVLLAQHVNDKFLNELEEKLHFKSDKRIKFVGTVYDQELLKKIRENSDRQKLKKRKNWPLFKKNCSRKSKSQATQRFF